MSQVLGIAEENLHPEVHADPAAIPEAKSQLDLSRRIPELDGMRGAAIAMVVFMHYMWLAITPQSSALLLHLQAGTRLFWAAVDLFFVLSGFLIGGNLLDARDTPNYFSTFYIRRFCRVLPIYFLFIALVGIADRFIYRPVGAPLDWVFAGRLPWYTYLSFAQNFWMTKMNQTGPPVLSITWAFAVEVQFYFVVPALIRFMRRSALPYLFIAGILIAPLLRLFVGTHFRGNLLAAYVLLPCRMDSLFVGLLCAYYLRQPKVWNLLIKQRDDLWIAFFALLGGMAVLNTKALPYTLLWVIVGYGWMSLFFACTLTLAVTKPDSPLSRALRLRWLTGLGTISYGVYLFHYGIYGLCMWLITGHEKLLGWTDFVVTLFALAVSISVGAVSWKYFEKPIVRWSHAWQYGERTTYAAPIREINPLRARLDGDPIPSHSSQAKVKSAILGNQYSLR